MGYARHLRHRHNHEVLPLRPGQQPGALPLPPGAGAGEHLRGEERRLLCPGHGGVPLPRGHARPQQPAGRLPGPGRRQDHQRGGRIPGPGLPAAPL